MSFATEKAQILPDYPVHIVDSVLLVIGVMDESVQNTLEVRWQRFGCSFVMGDDAQLASQSVFFQTANRCREMHKEYSRYCALLIPDSVGCKASIRGFCAEDADVLTAVVAANDAQILRHVSPHISL